MKTLRPYGVLYSISFYPFVICTVVIAMTRLPILWKALALLFGGLWLYSAGVNDHYMFEYDEEKFIVKNTWNPFFYQAYWITKLKRLEVDYFNRAGHGIRIFYDDSKDVFICACNKEDLIAMVDEVNELIKKVG